MDASSLPPNINHLWASLLIDELVRQGVGLFVVCPGSRSTPLAVAVAQTDADVLVHWDERAAAFVALGWGRATGGPAAVITTSGTAVANLLPAAIEADADGVPLLLLTADRPPELRETGANQTIRQPPIFQDVSRWSLDWPVPTSDVSARWVLSTAAHAVHRSLDPPGPVHLNLPFREPLGRQPDDVDMEAYLDGVYWEPEDYFGIAGDGPGGAVAVAGEQTAPTQSTMDSGWIRGMSRIERGLVVLALDDARTAEEAARLAEALGWPLLVDVRARGQVHAEAISARYDLVLVSENARRRMHPQFVLHVGGRLLSKRLGQLLVSAAPRAYMQLTEDQRRSDPDSLVTEHIVASVWDTLRSWAEVVESKPIARRKDAVWRTMWRFVGDAAEAVLQEERDRLSEPEIARRVSAQGATTLVVAASMPIRDLEAYGSPSRNHSRVIANRGASGIDGTVATAHGVARADGRPVVLLIGDLALLHDQTSLALLREGPPVIVVVINNDGGGIFHRLPIADGPGELAADTFERFFGTPHGLGFEDAARQVGLAYYAPDTAEAFASSLSMAIQSCESALIEVRTDRKEQAALRRQLEAKVAEAVDRALAGLDGR
ncbi:MAG: 2-succinyl-5-enolpyruvyl-6-hydroxy-3-cyclohexene-1-carboxylic-acid synthase [Rubricoccaceae bacterium]